MEQRSNEWFDQRIGKFTASEIYKLMGIKGLNETGKSYAFDKAVETFTDNVEETFLSFDMAKGVELEPLAFAKFKELKSIDFLDVDNCGFFGYCDNSGASPDGLVSDNAILEIKCPKNNTFFKLVADNVIDDKYLYQMQMQMLATDREKAYFFNYIVLNGQEFWHEIVIERDNDIIEKMKSRILEAIEVKKEYLNKFNNNKQWK
jgi:putative phage-type endonuclease